MERLPNHFRIISEVGRGGMAIVHKVLDKRDGKIYALKLLNSDKAGSYADGKRFKNEIELMKKIHSKNVVKICGYEFNSDYKFILMEYVEGNTLKDHLTIKKRMNPPEAVDTIKQLTKGFQALHDKGIIHRDIKSGNIIITGLGEAKIIDLGIAFKDGFERITKELTVICSPYYIAPEIVNQESPTAQTDIYSLGVLLYEMLTGDVPYKDQEPMSILQKHIKNDMPYVNSFFKNIPQALANVVIKSTARNKYDRYKNMKEFHKDISTSLSIDRTFEEIIDFKQKKRMKFSEFIISKWGLSAILIVFFVLLTSIILVIVGIK